MWVAGWVGRTVIIRLNSVQFELPTGTELGKNVITSRQPGNLIFGIPPYLTQIEEICNKKTIVVPSQKKRKKI